MIHSGSATPDLPCDRLERSRKTTRMVKRGSVIALLLVGIWALWPLSPAATQAPSVLTSATAARIPIAPLDLSGFERPLWTVAAAPAPPANTAAPPPPPALRLQLLGITEDPTSHERRAVVFDPEGNRILILASGDAVGPRSVKAIEPTAVTFALGEVTQSLALRPDLSSSRSPPGGRR